MPTSPTLRKDVERRYYLTHTTGVTGQTPYGELKRRYFIQYLAGSQTLSRTTSLNDLFILWVRKWCQAHGQTAPTQNFSSDAWKALVASLGIRPVNSTPTNHLNFFLNAP